MVEVGSLVLASDYNGVQQKISNVLGTGAPLGGPSNGHGYGITPASGTVTDQVTITAAQWNNLLSDVNKAYTHQNGRSFPGFALVSVGDLVTYDKLNLADRYADDCQTNYLNRATNQSRPEQFSSAGDIRTQAWGFGDSSVESEYIVSFSSAQDMNYYFNQGGTFSLVGVADLRNYRVQANKASVDEGSTVTFSLATQNVPADTVVPWTVTGVTSTDLSGASLTGTFIVGQTESVTFTVFANEVTDGDRSIMFALDSGQSMIGVPINDTSKSRLTSELRLFPGSPQIVWGQTATITIEPEVCALAVLCIGAGGGGGSTSDPGQDAGSGGGAGGWAASTYLIQGKRVVPEPGGKQLLWDQTPVSGWVKSYVRGPSVTYAQMVNSASTTYSEVINGQITINAASSNVTFSGSSNTTYLTGLAGSQGGGVSQSRPGRTGGVGGSYVSAVPAAPDMAGLGSDRNDRLGGASITRNQYVPLDDPGAGYGYGAGAGGQYRLRSSASLTGASGAVYIWKFYKPR
jgi:hypothetical protein